MQIEIVKLWAVADPVPPVTNHRWLVCPNFNVQLLPEPLRQRLLHRWYACGMEPGFWIRADDLWLWFDTAREATTEILEKAPYMQWRFKWGQHPLLPFKGGLPTVLFPRVKAQPRRQEFRFAWQDEHGQHAVLIAEVSESYLYVQLEGDPLPGFPKIDGRWYVPVKDAREQIAHMKALLEEWRGEKVLSG